MYLQGKRDQEKGLTLIYTKTQKVVWEGLQPLATEADEASFTIQASIPQDLDTSY